jgi:hypothetical protein
MPSFSLRENSQADKTHGNMPFFVIMNGHPCPIQASGNTVKLTKPTVIGFFK